jgi:SEC-C motif-containing protein
MTDEWSAEQWDASNAAIRAAAHAILDDRPLLLDEITVRLAQRGALASFDGCELDELEEIVDEALLETDDTWMSQGGTVSLTRELLRGVVLTHRATAGELERGVLDSTPDLGTITWGSGRSWSLVGGGEVAHAYPFKGEQHLSELGSYVGPNGWLDGIEPGELVGAWCDGERFGIVRNVTPDQVEQAVELVRDVFDELCDVESAMEPDELIMESLLRDPRIFRTPTAPFGELIEQAGLRLRGGWVGRADHDFTTPGERYGEARLERLASEYRLDTCCRDALERLISQWSGFVLATPDSRHEIAETWNPRRLRDDFRHGGASPAFVDYILDRHDHRVGLLDDFAALLSRYSELEPAASYLVAHNALCGGAAREALDASRRSASLDSDFGPAIDLHATLLADAGQAAGALSAHRKALTFGGSDHDVAFLSDLLKPFAQAGRNDLCPCGSGRKFKQCCQREPKLSLFDRRRLVVHQATWSLHERRRRETLFSLALEAFDASGAPTSEMQRQIARLLTDPFLVDVALFDVGRIDDYVHERGEIIPEPELVWLRSLAESRRSLWEYRRLDGDRFELRDVQSGDTRESITLNDRALHDQGYLLARIVDDAVDGTVGVVGPAHEISLAQRARLIELLDSDADGHQLAAWYGAQTAPPRFQNREGDSLAISTAYFTPIPGCDWQSIETALDELYERDGSGWTEFLDLGDERVVRAGMYRKEDDLVVSTNSVARFERVRDALLDVGLEFSRIEWPDDSHTDDEVSSLDGPEISDDDLDRIRDQMEDRWIAEHVPAFEGMTPRQAVDDPTRRDDVIKLIDSFEHRPAIGFAPYDYHRLRTKLGLPSRQGYSDRASRRA